MLQGQTECETARSEKRRSPLNLYQISSNICSRMPSESLIKITYKDRSCTDQIATLRIIVEQSMEWDSSLYINFVDYEKAFDTLDRDTLWKLLQHYGIPDKLISLIRNSYEDMTCRVVHAGQLTDSFMVKTGVRQGCLLSPFLFLLAIDWIDHEKDYNK